MSKSFRIRKTKNRQYEREQIRNLGIKSESLLLLAAA